MDRLGLRILMLAACGFWVGSTYAAESMCAQEPARLKEHINISRQHDTEEQVGLFSECVARNKVCVLSVSPSDKAEIIGTGSSYKAAAHGENEAEYAAGDFTDRKKRDVCIFVAYSGGSAAAWTVVAWTHVDGKFQFINTSNIDLTGEVISADHIIGEMKNISTKLR